MNLLKRMSPPPGSHPYQQPNPFDRLMWAALGCGSAAWFAVTAAAGPLFAGLVLLPALALWGASEWWELQEARRMKAYIDRLLASLERDRARHLARWN